MNKKISVFERIIEQMQKQNSLLEEAKEAIAVVAVELDILNDILKTHFESQRKEGTLLKLKP